MTLFEYQKEVATQVSTVSGVLAGFSFAVLFQLYTADEKKRIDRWLVVVFLVSSLALILTTILGGMMSFSYSLLGADTPTQQAAAFDRVGNVNLAAFTIGFCFLFLGIGLGGFRFKQAIGYLSAFLSFIAVIVFCVALKMIGSTFEKRPNQSPEPTAMSATPPAAQEPRQP